MTPVYTMAGVGEILEVFEDKVRITPQGVLGFLTKGLKGTKTIPIASMRAIQFKKSAMTNGYLQFTVPGGNESRGGVFSAASDENTFMFAGQNELAESIRDFIEARMQVGRSPAKAAAGWVAELSQLAELRSQGALSEEEFQRAKEKLLGPA